eukprot:TRINITY_DN2659_c1_g1_i1.p1 TRINITY_DN2659_c1_g1~~TRINITY_DN2659_c1_g1_i1.p1  ORF type:complete len:198 (+),score=18.54 TRINITY_DN2659_c1_g1_i1:48-596(+)
MAAPCPVQCRYHGEFTKASNQRSRCRSRLGLVVLLTLTLACVLLDRSAFIPPMRDSKGQKAGSLDMPQTLLVAAGLAAAISPELVAAQDAQDAQDLLFGGAVDTEGREETVVDILKGWYEVAPYYGAVLYVICLIVQRVALKYYNEVYLASAVLWIGPPVFMLFNYKFGEGSEPVRLLDFLK